MLSIFGSTKLKLKTYNLNVRQLFISSKLILKINEDGFIKFNFSGIGGNRFGRIGWDLLP